MTLLPELLEHQNLLLDSLLTLLEEEFNFLKQRQVSELPEIAHQKQQLLEQLQQQDQQISQHPDRDALKDELSPLKEALVEKLRHCQDKNEVNGKLIELNLAANRRLGSVLTQLRDRNSMTYDSKGSARASGGSNLNLKA